MAGRVSPRQASYFSLLRQRNLTKRKATRSLGPCAALWATCAARRRRKFQKLVCCAAFGQLKFLSVPSCAAQPSQDGFKAKNRNRGAERAKRVLRNLAVGISSPTPSVCAEERRARRIRARDCLSRRRVRARPRLDRAPQGARSAAKGRRQQGRLSFGYFSLAKQRTSASPAGARPGLVVKGAATNSSEASTLRQAQPEQPSSSISLLI